MLRCENRRQLVMKKPNGDTYTFISPDITALRGNEVLISFRVSRVTDSYGNWLQYDYTHVSSNHRGPDEIDMFNLRTISASDGREVNFTYLENIRLLTEVRSNASPKPHIIKYKRTQGDPRSIPHLEVDHNGSVTRYRYINRHAGNRFNGLIDQIEYPTKARVQYKYKFDASTDDFSKTGDSQSYPRLIERKTSDNGSNYSVYTFDVHNLGNGEFARIVNNPEFATEFRYKKASRMKFANGRFSAPSGIDGNDGQLIGYKVFKKNKFNWYADKKALLAKEYEYEIVSSINSIIKHQDTNLVALKKERTILANSNSLLSNVTFEKRYFNHDDFGNPLMMTEKSSDGSSRSTTLSYKNPNQLEPWIVGLESSVSVNSGDTMVFKYNSKGSVTEQVENGIPTYFDYFVSSTGQDDAHGELKSITDAENSKESFWSYRRGIPRRHSDKKGRITYRDINLDGTLKWETRPGDLSNKNRFYYDRERRLYKEKSSRGSTLPFYTKWSSDRRTRERRSEDDSYIEKEVYDAFGRTIFFGIFSQTANDYSWRSQVFAYNDIGQRTFASLPLSEDDSVLSINYTSYPGHHYSYDSLGRMTEDRIHSGVENTVSRYKYDIHNSKFPRVTTTDRRGNNSFMVFKSYGEPSYDAPVEHRDENGVITYTSRDKGLRVLSIKRNGVVRRFEYNNKKQLSAEKHPEYGRVVYSYFPDGMLRQKNVSGGRQIINYTYTSNNEISKKVYNKGNVNLTRSFSYDNHGNLVNTKTRSSDNTQNNDREVRYDTENNIIVERLQIDGRNYEMRYLYDGISNLLEVTYPYIGGTYSLAPNAHGDATKIAEINGKQILDSIQYHANGSFRDIRSPNGQIQSQLDSSQRTNNRLLFSLADSRERGSVRYDYDRNSNISAKTDGRNKSTNYGYDKANRLTSANIDGRPNWAFGYTANDNIDWVQDGDSFVDYHYNSSRNILTKITAQGRATRNFKTDTWGNLYSLDMYQSDENKSARITRKLTFDPANQVSKINNGSAYEYDSRGLRVRSSKNGDVYTFYDYQNKLRYRHDASSGTESVYFYVNDQLVARRDRGIGEPPQNQDGPVDDGRNGGGKPAAPTNVQATEQSSTSVRVSWNAVGAAEKYNVRRDGKYHKTVSGLTSFVDTGLSAGKTYSYEIVSVDEDQQDDDRFSDKSASASITLGSNTGGGNNDGRPAAPTNVQATEQSSTSARVSWNAVGAAEKYNVRRDGQYHKTVSGSTSFVDTGLSAGNTYSYEIVSVDEDQQGDDRFSDKSATASITLGNGGGSTTGGITVSGNKIVIPADGYYQIQTAGNPDFWQGHGGTSRSVPNGTYTVINLTAGKRYENIKVPQ